jgi:periplasmic protein TonB
MKKTFFAITAGLCMVVFTSCNSDSTDKNTVATKPDSSMMAGPTTTSGGNPETLKPDSLANSNMGNMNTTAPADTMMGKPNPAKKGKKGIVSLNMDMNKPMGNEDMTDKEGYYTNVYPSYPGGDKELANFFSKNIKYPQDAEENGVEGTVTISFTVDEKGKVAMAKTTNNKLGYGLEEEALRVFNKMPVWKPGALKGKNVKTRYTLPVRFQLES